MSNSHPAFLVDLNLDVTSSIHLSVRSIQRRCEHVVLPEGIPIQHNRGQDEGRDHSRSQSDQRPSRSFGILILI